MYMVYADYVSSDLETHVDRILESVFFRSLEDTETYAMEYIDEFLSEKKVKRSGRKWIISDKMPETKYIRLEIAVEETLFVYITKVVLDETDIESVIHAYTESTETLTHYAELAFHHSCRNLAAEKKRRWWNEEFKGFEIKGDSIYLHFVADMHINHRGDIGREEHAIVSSLESFKQFINNLNKKKKDE